SGIRRTFADAGHSALAGDRVRQGLEDRALRVGQRFVAQSGGAEARLRERARIRSGRRPGEDGPAVRGVRHTLPVIQCCRSPLAPAGPRRAARAEKLCRRSSREPLSSLPTLRPPSGPSPWGVALLTPWATARR